MRQCLKSGQCDERRPYCGQCEKSGKDCDGFDSEPGGLLFKSENAYASNRSAKRPRGGARRTQDRRKLQKVSSSRSSSRQPPAERAISDSSTDTLPLSLVTSLTRNVSVPLEWQAFDSFNRDYVNIEYRSGDGVWGLLNYHPGFDFGPAAPETALNLAASAVSLAVFGQRHHAPEALDESQEKYSRALIETQVAIADIDLAVTDQVLCTVMFLAAYEDRVGNLKLESLTPDGFRHQEGATALLKLRQQQQNAAERSLLLEKFIRRQIIRISLFRGLSLPTWLSNGAEYAEEGPELELDHCLVRTVQLRHRLFTLLQSATSVAASERYLFIPDLQNAIKECIDVDQHLRTWALGLPVDYDYITHDTVAAPTSEDSIFYHDSIHVYNGLKYALQWNRYRAARSVVNALLCKALTWSLSISDPTSLMFVSDSRLGEVKGTLRKMADDICASLPFHLGIVSPTAFDSVSAEFAMADLAPAQVYPLVWPLTICSAQKEIPDLQRRWIKHKLRMIGDITGSRTLKMLAGLNIHQSSALVPSAEAAR